MKFQVALPAADPPDNVISPAGETCFCDPLKSDLILSKILTTLNRDWLGNIRLDCFSGIVVAFALIPEAIGFSVVAGVDPKVGLYASVVIACVIAFTGGRVAMISAATASTAVLMGGLVHHHGVQYLFAATILMGVFQLLAGLFRLDRLMKFVSRSVITGFVNALAILIFLAQMPQLIHVPVATYGLIAIGLGIIYLFPLVTKAVPSALVAVAVLTIITTATGLHVRTVASLGQLPTTLPHFGIPQVPFTVATLWLLLPLALTLAAVGLLETQLTAQIVDEMTDTPSARGRESSGQGIANIASAFFGGMGGCAMIGQSVINISSGGRGRLSTLVSGAFLLLLLVAMQHVLALVPVAALTAVMIMVSINTFSWRSLLQLRSNPKTSSAVMLATVLVVVTTGNLSAGVLVGVLLSGVFFASKVSQLSQVTSSLSACSTTQTFHVSGQIFFASAGTLTNDIHVVDATVKHLVIDLTQAHFWDISAIGALDALVMRERRRGFDVQVIGLNEASATMVERYGVHHKTNEATL